MKLFSQIFSCYRPRPTTQESNAPPSNNDSHSFLPPAATDNRPLKRGRCHWRPALSIIMEDHIVVAEDNDKNVDRKQYKKSSNTWVYDEDGHFVGRRRKFLLITTLPPFSMF